MKLTRTAQFAAILLAAGLSSTHAMAQSKYNERVAEIKKDIAALPAGTTGTVVMLGDSITHGFFTSKSMPATLAGLPVVNEGISGDQVDRSTSSTGIVNRLPEITAAKPAVVFVLIGINDMWGGKESPEDTIKQYEDMVPKLKAAAPGATVVLQSILPTSMKNAYLNEGVTTVNKRIKELAEANDMQWLDLHPLMEDDKGELKADFTGDGVHLTPAAYGVWLKKLEEVTPGLLSGK